MRQCRPEHRSRLGSAGCGRQAGRRRRICRARPSRFRDGLVRLLGGGRSRCCGRRAWACGRLRAGWGGRRPRLRASCARCGHAGWRAGVSGHHGALARGAAGTPAEAGEAGRQHSVAGVCAGPPVRRRGHSGRNGGDWARGAVDGWTGGRVDGTGAGRRGRGKSHVGPDVLISRRPAEAADRAAPGHWEGDFILGLGSSAVGTLVERTTRFAMLLHVPPMDGHGCGPRVKNGPALAGHGAEAVRDAIAREITSLPEQLRRPLTWDQGAETSQHARLRIDTGLAVYFCDPRSPWQRGTNENANGLLRQCFPKGADLSASVWTTSRQWPPHSTAGRARRSDGERRPGRLTRRCGPRT